MSPSEQLTTAEDRALVKDEMGTEAAYLVSELMLQHYEQTNNIEAYLMKSLEKENEELREQVSILKKIIWKVENHFMGLLQEER